MEYKTRHLTSESGMTQKEALLSLQKDPSFKQGSVVASIRRRDDQWVAEVLEPKTAEFPPKKDDNESDNDSNPDAPPTSDPDNDGDDDSSPSGDTDKDFAGGDDKKPSKSDGDKPEGGKGGGVEEQILHLVQQILHAVQPGGGVGNDASGLAPGGPPPPPPGPSGPPGPGGPPGAGAPGGKPKSMFPPKALKPGDTPPGGTPIGAPAFASAKQGEYGMAPVPTGQAGPVNSPAGVCPQCGGPQPCPEHSGLNQAVAAKAGKSATLYLATKGENLKKAVEEARIAVKPYGYEVKQAKFGQDRIHILASRR